MISVAIQRANYVDVRDENNHQIAYVMCGVDEKHGLAGYTASTFSVRMGDSLQIYDDQGRQINQIPL